jgi:hypothetical protein
VSTFINLKLLSADQIAKIQEIQKARIGELSGHSMDLVNALDVKPWMVYAPIASDWVAYNKENNHGELIRKAKM